MTQGEMGLFMHRLTVSAGAAFRASSIYLLLNPISSPWPSPFMGHSSLASPRAVLTRIFILSFSNRQRMGLRCFSVMIRLTRSMVFKSWRLSLTIMVLYSPGMALR